MIRSGAATSIKRVQCSHRVNTQIVSCRFKTRSDQGKLSGSQHSFVCVNSKKNLSPAGWLISKPIHLSQYPSELGYTRRGGGRADLNFAQGATLCVAGCTVCVWHVCRFCHRVTQCTQWVASRISKLHSAAWNRASQRPTPRTRNGSDLRMLLRFAASSLKRKKKCRSVAMTSLPPQTIWVTSSPADDVIMSAEQRDVNVLKFVRHHYVCYTN